MNIPMKGINTTESNRIIADSVAPAPIIKPSSSASHLVIDPSAVAEMLFNTMVIYGPTGVRKTTQIGEFAKHIYAKTGKVTRLISLDGGGWGPIQDLINAGIIDAWRMVEEPNPKVALIKASKGAWPVKLVNGLRGDARVSEPTPLQKREFLKDVGAYAVEGWASIARAIIRDTVARGTKISEDVVGKFSEQAEGFEGAETFGAPGKSHYGFVQNLLLDIIRNFSALPVERILYTSLEAKGEDKLLGKLEYGPMAAGSAITSIIPTFVGDCLHFEDFIDERGVDPANPKQKLVEPGVRVWFTQHPDPITGVMWPAKPRIVGSKYEEFKSLMGPNGYFILSPERNLGTYLAIQDSLLAASSDDARAWKAEIDAKRNIN